PLLDGNGFCFCARVVQCQDMTRQNGIRLCTHFSPTCFITWFQYFTSRLTMRANSCGPSPVGGSDILNRRCSISGACKIFVTSAATRSTTAVGVPAGAKRPNQSTTPSCGRPISSKPGTLGSAGERGP